MPRFTSPTEALLADPFAAFELHFQSLFHEGRALVFPCDAQGHVPLDALSERSRHNYLYARAVVGREYGVPAIRARDLH